MVDTAIHPFSTLLSFVSGNTMKSKISTLLLGLGALLTLTSCSGLKQSVCTVNCGGGGGGTANVTLTLFDTPPAGALFLNFNLPITSISLTPSGGGADVALLSTPTTFEMRRLQSDSSLVGTFSVAAGTYTALNIFVTNSPSSVWYNGSSLPILGCASGAVCNLSGGAPGKISVDLISAVGGSGLVLTSKQNIGLGLDFKLNNAVTTTGGISIDLTQPNVFSVVALPRTNQASGTLDTIQDFTGVVTAVSAGSISVKSPSRGTLVAALNSSTAYVEVPTLPNQCSGGPSQRCIKLNSTVSLDATIAPSGTATATVVDIIDVTAVDEVEGILYPTTTAGVYGMIVSDTAVPSGNATLTSIGPGTGIYVIFATAPVFTIDSKDFPISSSTGFLGTGDLVSGQQVRVQVASLSTLNGLTLVTASAAILRFTRLTAAVGTTAPTSSVLYLENSTINSFYGSFLTEPQVQTYNPQTIIDGTVSLNALAAGDPVSVSALFLNPNKVSAPFIATKIRKH